MLKRTCIILLVFCFSSRLLSCEQKRNNVVISAIAADFNCSTINIGDTVQPFKNFDFNKAEIRISPDDDMDLSGKVPKGNRLVCSKHEVLKRIKNWKFIYTGGDIATVQNSIKLFMNGNIVASSQIVLDKRTAGLQSQHYGWMPAVDSNYIFGTVKLFKSNFLFH